MDALRANGWPDNCASRYLSRLQGRDPVYVHELVSNETFPGLPAKLDRAEQAYELCTALDLWVNVTLHGLQHAIADKMGKDVSKYRSSMKRVVQLSLQAQSWTSNACLDVSPSDRQTFFKTLKDLMQQMGMH